MTEPFPCERGGFMGARLPLMGELRLQASRSCPHSAQSVFGRKGHPQSIELGAVAELAREAGPRFEMIRTVEKIVIVPGHIGPHRSKMIIDPDMAGFAGAESSAQNDTYIDAIVKHRRASCR